MFHYLYYLSFVFCTSLFVFVAPVATPMSSVTAQVGEVRLPVEVLGSDGYVAAVDFTVDDTTGVDHLYLRIHRPAYRDALMNTETGAKASVQLNDGSWVDLTNETVEVDAPASDYGGLGGGFHTVRMRLPIQGVRLGANTLRFRFNGTDGFTSGYRVLALNLLRDRSPVLPESTFTTDDPSGWTAPLSSTADIAQGRELWYANDLLVESPLSNRILIAGCSDCHAQDGRDLQYFNYSNRSIEARSAFHGLTDRQGKQIASYIRSLPVSYADLARPWNPPYQPGPGLDSKPIDQWAAGAGLEAVLDHDRDMLPYLYPQGTDQDGIDQVIDSRKTVNVREMPLPLQLPDWNAWLPDEHPMDMWGDHFKNDKANQVYTELRDYLVALESGEDGVADDDLLNNLNRFRDETNKFIGFMTGAQPCIRYYGNPDDQVTDNVDKRRGGTDCEQALMSLNQWSAVKHWEVMQEFALEELTDEIYPSGEVRGWPGRWRQVFEIAAHRSANNSQHFEYQTKAAGAVQSASWYQLQMVLNAGNRDPHTWFPQDWFYTPAYIANTAIFNEVELGNLITLSQLKMYQNLDLRGPDGQSLSQSPQKRDWWLPFITPWRFESARSENYLRGIPWTDLDAYEPGLRARVTGAFLRQFLNKMSTYPIGDLPREAAEGENDSAYDNINTVPEPYQEGDHAYYSVPGNAEHATAIYRTIPRFIEMGVDPAIVNEYIDWCKAVWPRGDWDELRPAQNAAFTEPGAFSTHGLDKQAAPATLHIYPNPVRDLLMVEGPSSYALQLYDAGGKVVQRLERQSSQAQLSVRHLPPGVYLLQITDAATGYVHRRKVVVE